MHYVGLVVTYTWNREKQMFSRWGKSLMCFSTKIKGTSVRPCPPGPSLRSATDLLYELNFRPRIGGLNAEISNELSGQSLYLWFVFTAKSYRNSKKM